MTARSGRAPRTWEYLFAATGTVLLVAIAALAAVSLVAVRRTALRQSEENLRQFSYAVARMLDTEPRLLDPAELQRFCENLGKEREFRVTFVDAAGTEIADSGANPASLENHATRPEIAAALAGEERAAVRASSSVGKRMVYYAVPYRGNALRLAMSVGYIDSASRTIAGVLVAAALAIFAFAVAVTLLATRKITVPVSALAQTAHRFSDGSLDLRIDATGFPRELAELADTLSIMAARLDEKIRALDRQNRETGAILSGMNDALIVIDRDLRVERANPAACELFSLDPESARGIPLIQAVRSVEIVDLVARGAPLGDSETVELKTPAGAKSLLVRVSRTGDDGLAILAFGDVTRLKRLERVRQDFVANVSHELKTPVTSIQGFIETLKDGAMEDPAAARKFLDIMDQQSARLAAIVDDLLAISRLEQAEGTEIPREPTRIANLFEEVRTLCADIAAKKGTTLVFDPGEGLECAVNPGLVEQAIVNLVLNGIKYSPSGARVAVTARLKDAPEGGLKDGKTLVVEVADNGIGISEKNLERVFERFYRVDAGRSREQGGTGLGLSIVRHIALAHGGTVSVKSVEGEGSVFTMEIPA